MKNRKDSEIFSLSFLDIICCGFGAMVLLVLLSKTDVAGGVLNTERIQNLIRDLAAEQQRKTASVAERDRLRARANALEVEITAAGADRSNLQQRLAAARATAKILQIQTGAQTTGATDEVVKVGGIPVDAEHIIFIVDTSGSMQQIWQRVIAELENVIEIHPQVKGFQIMNDNGAYLIKSYKGKWIPDTPGRRKSVLSAMRSWRSVSNSSPVEGLERALKTYAKRTDKLAIYIFGDDYSGASYDLVLDTVAKLNRDPNTGEPLARIHGIGFQQANHHTERFATLMREVARQNRGAFIALGLHHRATITESDRLNRN